MLRVANIIWLAERKRLAYDDRKEFGQMGIVIVNCNKFPGMHNGVYSIKKAFL